MSVRGYNTEILNGFDRGCLSSSIRRAENKNNNQKATKVSEEVPVES